MFEFTNSTCLLNSEIINLVQYSGRKNGHRNASANELVYAVDCFYGITIDKVLLNLFAVSHSTKSTKNS